MSNERMPDSQTYRAQHAFTSQRVPVVQESGGNGTLVVLVDTTRPEYLHLPTTLFAALAHFGMPYRLRDLSLGPLHAEELLRHRGVVIAQEHLGEALRPADLAEILKAVHAGVGLVNFDFDVRRYDQSYMEALGFVLAARTAAAASGATVTDNTAFLTYTRTTGERIPFKRAVPAFSVKTNAGTAPVCFGDGSPLLVACGLGEGRVVQWLVSPKLWLPEVLGHARGLDDLFWKSIVWAARKPFVMKAMPPFVRIRLDDCKGYWRDGRDLDLVDVLNDFGHIPNLGLCMRAVTADGGQRIKKLFDGRKADFSPHTLAPDVSLFYGDDAGEYSTARLTEIMTEMDAQFTSWGIRPSRVLSDHNHMWSPRAIPFLLERGITFKMNVTCPGETWEGVHVNWRPAPYGQMEYVFDTIPGHPEFFVAFNHYPTLEAARFALPGGRFLFNREGGFGDVKWDFLNGLTRTALGQNDLASMARRYADHLRLGLDSLFFGGVITHTHFLKDLSLGELREVLQQAEALTTRHAKRYESYERIAEYARSKVETHLSQVDVSGNDNVAVTVVGRASMPLELYVFKDVDGGVDHRFEVVGDCDGMRRAEFSA
jgi:hypothetical protein